MNFRTFAKNGVGYGAYSTTYLVVALGIPIFMNPPQAILADINPTWISVTWLGISVSQAGGSAPLYYGIQWD